MAQGKERSRLTSDSTMRETGEWQTIICAAGNRPLMDAVMSETEATPAGAVRVYEFEIPDNPQPNDPVATTIIAQTETNHGHAGRVYARWLAENYSTAEKVIQAAMQGFTDDLKAQRDERLYVAGMSCIYAGASIAQALGLVAFELPSLREFLCATFRELRTAREETVLVTAAGGYDLHQILGNFVTEHAARKIVTNYFANTGHGRAPTVRLSPALNAQGPVIHISEIQKVMRVDRTVFVQWAHKNKLPGPNIVASMVKTWGALSGKGRYTMGGGTPFSAGDVRTIEIPLTAHGLQAYLPATNPPP
jgi:hypothetical protein